VHAQLDARPAAVLDHPANHVDAFALDAAEVVVEACFDDVVPAEHLDGSFDGGDVRPGRVGRTTSVVEEELHWPK
jgi:hypothetical protein